MTTHQIRLIILFLSLRLYAWQINRERNDKFSLNNKLINSKKKKNPNEMK